MSDDDEKVRNERELRYAVAMHAVECGCHRDECIRDGGRLARNAITVADAEQAELRAEIERKHQMWQSAERAADAFERAAFEWKGRAEVAESKARELADESRAGSLARNKGERYV